MIKGAFSYQKLVQTPTYRILALENYLKKTSLGTNPSYDSPIRM